MEEVTVTVTGQLVNVEPLDRRPSPYPPRRSGWSEGTYLIRWPLQPMDSRNGPRNPCLSILACRFFLLLLLLQPAAGVEPLGAWPGKIGLLVKRRTSRLHSVLPSPQTPHHHCTILPPTQA